MAAEADDERRLRRTNGDARTDVFVKAAPDADRQELVDEAIRRGRAFLSAGAPVVFVPRLVDREEIRQVATALGERRLTLISPPGAALPAAELQELGVARVSTGPFTQRVALTALQDAAVDIVGGGVLPSNTRALN